MTAKHRPSLRPPEPGEPLVVGLTGGIGSGKTAVSSLFENLGVAVIDTDVIARELVNTPLILKKIIDVFGKSMLGDDGTLDRKKLAGIVFRQKKDRQKLENILHPIIRSEVKERIRTLRSSTRKPPYVIVVIPLLLETGFTDLVHRILVVISDEKTRIERVKQRDNRDVDEIRSIISSQVNDEKRLNRADDIIENNSDFKALEKKVRHQHNIYLDMIRTGKQKS